MTFFSGFLLSPDLRDEDLSDRARTLHVIVLSVGFIATLFLSALAVAQPAAVRQALGTLAVVDCFCFSLIQMNRRGLTIPAAWTMIGGLLAIVAYRAVYQGGIQSPGMGLLPVLILMAGLLLGEGGSLVVAAVSGFVAAGLTAADVAGLLPAPLVFNPVARLMLNLLYLGLIAVLARLIVRRLQSALRGANAELAERVSAAAALAASEERYRSIVETSDEGILLTDGEGVITFVNPKLCSLLGYKPEELLGQGYPVLIFPEDLTGVRERRDARKRGQSLRMNMRLRRKDGGAAAIFISANDLYDERGLRSGTLAMISEMSGHDQTQAELLQAGEPGAIGDLSGGFSHDFNRLLGAITGFSHRLRASFEESGPRREDLQEIVGVSRRAAGLTRQLIAHGRKQTPAPAPVLLNFNAILPAIEKKVRPVIGAKIAFELSMDPALSWCRADRAQAELVIVSLVANARDAMPQGGLITLATRNVVLDAEEAAALGVAAGPYVQASVADTGVGITEEVQKRIFDPFLTAISMGSGAGMGMSKVHGIVKQSGGVIRVTRSRGFGTTFEVLLPVAAPPPKPGPAMFLIWLLAAALAAPAAAFNQPPLNLAPPASADGGAPAPHGLILSEYAIWIDGLEAIGEDGHRLPGKARARALYQLHQVFYQSDIGFLGGKLALNVMLPVVAITGSGSLGPKKVTVNRAGVGDLIVGPALLFPVTRLFGGPLIQRFETYFIFPTGRYDKSFLGNPGANFATYKAGYGYAWAFAPLWATTGRLQYAYNEKNQATGAQSGQVFNFIYGVSREVAAGLRLGVSGYYIRQTTPDKLKGVANPGSEERAFAIGPILAIGRESFAVVVNHPMESGVRNRFRSERTNIEVDVKF